KLYNNREPQPQPDYEALADMVANRATDAVARSAAVAGGASLDEAGMAEIEARLSRLLEARDVPGSELDGMQTGIREVNERLARLEATLTARARETAAAPAEAPRDAAPVAGPPPAPAPQATVPPPPPARARRSDSMPKSPRSEEHTSEL